MRPLVVIRGYRRDSGGDLYGAFAICSLLIEQGEVNSFHMPMDDWWLEEFAAFDATFGLIDQPPPDVAIGNIIIPNTPGMFGRPCLYAH